MHKYKRAETVYDNFDVATFIIELLTVISGNRECEKKIVSNNVTYVNDFAIKMYLQRTWISNIANAVFADPPVSYCVTITNIIYILDDRKMFNFVKRK